MSDKNEWIKKAIADKFFKLYEFKNFSNVKVIGAGEFGAVYRANWKDSEQYVALKTFKSLNNNTAKEIVHELELQREVDYHKNIIRFHGITMFEENNGAFRNYSLVMEYANNGTLQDYLKKDLTWDAKFEIAYQLACAVSCLHNEGIVHRDLHSKNVLVHDDTIKLADFGLSKRIDKSVTSNITKLFGVIPYIDPKKFNNPEYKLNKTSDVYSIGVLLWEISSGKRPFKNEKYDLNLGLKILEDHREEIIPNTPTNYSKLYTECWDIEPNNRPNMKDVLNRLKKLINKQTNNDDQNDQDSDNNTVPDNDVEINVNEIKDPCFSDNLGKNSNGSSTGEFIINELAKIMKTNDLNNNMSNINEIKNSNFSPVDDKPGIKGNDNLDNKNFDEIKNPDFSSVVDKFGIKETIELKGQEKPSNYNLNNKNVDEIKNSDFSSVVDKSGIKETIEIKEQEKPSNYNLDNKNVDEIKNSDFPSVVDKSGIKETIEIKKQEKPSNDNLDNKSVNEIKNSDFSSVADKSEIKETIEVTEQEKGSNDQINKLDNVISNSDGVEDSDFFSAKDTIEVMEQEKESNDHVSNSNNSVPNNSKVEDNTNMNLNENNNTNFRRFNEKKEQEKKSYDNVNKIIDEIVKRIFEGEDLEKILDNYNSREIYDWLENNQNENDPNTIFLLGKFYYSGIDVITNKRKAFELYREAAFKGHNIAQHDVACMYKSGKEVVDKNHKLAFELFNKSAEGEYLNGINMLGECHYKGIGTNVNKQKAISYFQIAANLGNSNAQYNIAQMYMDGEIVDKDDQMAFEYFKKSAKGGGCTEGIFMVGYCYSNGIGTDVDKEYAFEFYKRAAKLGHHLAQYNLGLMYENGIYVEQNEKIALEYYRKSTGEGGMNVINMLADCFDGKIDEADGKFAKDKYISLLDVLVDGFNDYNKLEIYQSFAKVNDEVGKMNLPKIAEDYRVGEGIVKNFTNLLSEGKDGLNKVYKAFK
ncbi:hypothetical protein RclHR1_00590026 [Rhizophagus clarus]|uniref:Kinase-like domain-containing protein n=1 Tax=Rhizophagus clarus TaxID=94130 RepID=A0A2Z6S6L7_9GLOM|nr:hypothetical protein RclHR1_00590026 [Rhizophagus clarus]GES92485.1 kinase-like domain-containing protein [Rhizophagus clarus]